MTSRALRFGLFAACAGLIIFQIWTYLDYRLEADDDLIWLYQSAQLLTHGTDLVANHYGSFNSYLDANSAGTEWTTRAAARQSLGESQNYLATTAWIAAVSWIVQGAMGVGNYAAYLANVLFWSSATLTTGVALLVAAVFMSFRDPRLAVGFGLALVVLLVLDAVGNVIGDAYTTELISKRTLLAPGYFLHSFIHTIIDPTPAFTPWYPPAKNRAQMLLMLIMVFRWGGRPSLSYGMLLFGALWHQDYIGLFTLAFIVADLVRQPRIFKSPLVTALAAGGIVLYFARGSLLYSAVSSLSPTTLLVIGVAIVAVVLALYMQRHRIAVMQRHFFGQGHKPFTENIVQDVIVLGTLWMASLLALIPISLSTSAISSELLWGSVHGRLYGMIHPSLVLGGCVIIAATLITKLGEVRALSASLAMVAACTVAVALWSTVIGTSSPSSILNRMEMDLVALEGKQPASQPSEAAEALFYYLSAKSIDIDRNLVEPAFSTKR